jgi:hypothetical protein
MHKLIYGIFFLIIINLDGFAQEYSSNSIKTGIGIGMSEGIRETGIGSIVSLGYQKSLWQNRLRINPYILSGGFFPFGVTDVRDQYFKITSLGVNGYLDILKYKSVSIFIGAGGLVNYTRGLFGTGGMPESGITSSEYFFKLYYGGYLGGGLRINPAKSRFAYELTPFNICFGNDYFVMAYFKFGIDINLNKNE